MLTALTLYIHAEKDGHNVIRRKRAFGSSAPPCNSKYISWFLVFRPQVLFQE